LRNSAKDASVDLYVREDMLKEPGNTQTAIIFVYRGGGPRFGPLEFLMGVGTLGLRWLAGVFALGAVFGSIINTLAYRLGRGLPVLRRPECPECGAPRTAVEMVPILGWLVSFGRCRTKGERIGARQPVLAAIGGFMLYGATLGGGRYFVAPVLTYVACAALLVALVVELDRVTAPAKVYWTVGGAAVLLDAWHIVRQGTRWMLNFPFQHGAQTIIVSLPRCVVGAAIGAAAMLALARLVSGRWGLLGDVKVAAVVGALVATAGYSPKWPLAAVLAGAVIGLIVWLARRLPEGRPRYLPLAMAAAGLVAALAPAALMMFAPTMTNMLLFGL
jgi:prepilin signal peptidase PulO-like enzyme (type II secretory pathway)